MRSTPSAASKHAEGNHAGFRWPIVAEQTIAASAEEVWKVISTPGNLELCHPFCGKNPVQHWSRENSVDQVHYLNGRVYERRFNSWQEGVGYDLEIISRGTPLAAVTWRIASVDASSCVLRITVYPYMLQKYPVGLRWLPHFFFLRPKLTHYLISVVKGFEWFITHGQAVPRNQFGEHAWFSAAES